MVVDHVEQHGQPDLVAGIHQLSQVIGRALAGLGREEIGWGVSLAGVAGEFAGGQELDSIEVHALDVRQFGDDIREIGGVVGWLQSFSSMLENFAPSRAALFSTW